MRKYETLDDAKLLAQDVLSQARDANAACALIASISTKLQHPEPLEIFYALTHDQSGYEHVGILASDCLAEIFAACRRLLSEPSPQSVYDAT